jgi:hypothetical protein
MPIRKGQTAVNKLVTDDGKRTAQTPAEFAPLLPEAHKRARQFDDCYLTCRDNKGDRCLAYPPHSHELEMWHLGLMLVEYVAGLLLDKAKIGHCYAETRTNPVCSLSRDMHLKMLAALKDDLRALADEIQTLEDTGKPTWPKADPHPQPK